MDLYSSVENLREQKSRIESMERRLVIAQALR